MNWTKASAVTRNCLWLWVPPLGASLALWGQLPSAYQPEFFDRWIPPLLGYAETFSAIDLRAMIEVERRAGQSVFVTGGSGGTILAQRFLQLFPDAVDGVILEAINAPDRTIVDWGDAHASAMRNLLDVNCAGDPACGPRLGAEPFAAWVVRRQYLTRAQRDALAAPLVATWLRALREMQEPEARVGDSIFVYRMP